MMREHDGEPIHGLPERPPEGERVLWQGRPDAWALAKQAFHLPAVTGYFALLGLGRVVLTVYQHGTVADIIVQVAVLAVLCAAAVLMFGFMAWLTARSTVYTITNRRVVMRIGVALPLTINLPFSAVESAAMRPYGAGLGDIPLTLRERHKLGYLVFWPHVRPWRFAAPQPMLRAIPDAEKAARILTDAFIAASEDRVTRPALRLSVADGPSPTLSPVAG